MVTQRCFYNVWRHRWNCYKWLSRFFFLNFQTFTVPKRWVIITSVLFFYSNTSLYQFFLHTYKMSQELCDGFVQTLRMNTTTWPVHILLIQNWLQSRSTCSPQRSEWSWNTLQLLLNIKNSQFSLVFTNVTWLHVQFCKNNVSILLMHANWLVKDSSLSWW